MEELKRRLGEIYKKVPELECKKCGECCGPIWWSAAEEVVIREYMREHGIEYKRVTTITKCPYLREDNTCEIYEVRPLICRLFGVVEDLKCPKGAKPKRYLKTEEAVKLMMELVELSVIAEREF